MIVALDGGRRGSIICDEHRRHQVAIGVSVSQSPRTEPQRDRIAVTPGQRRSGKPVLSQNPRARQYAAIILHERIDKKRREITIIAGHRGIQLQIALGRDRICHVETGIDIDFPVILKWTVSERIIPLEEHTAQAKIKRQFQPVVRRIIGKIRPYQ